ncbi:iron complex transport system substrate-binding protein [Breznakia blatticola]|uniref:Iron complex transport system substrate-binding protein n=1 Tax=Breznakia blatticola TaxID=1754012 RepID=A0A4R7Z8K5_9FIRM|nr:ABC transporter substrate-binding protein [Breznakia blatticola]TDW11063.1 iron complex transport system substrate-binding protein [Breznakia blatticola]
MKKVIAMLLTCFILFGCQNATQNKDEKNTVVSVTDSIGNKVTVAKDAKQVVVLGSSWVDLYKLAGGMPVATTSDANRFDYINGNKDVEIVGDVKKPNLEKIVALQPDLVILGDDLAGHKALTTSLEEASIPVFVTKVEKFDDYLNVLKSFTMITGDTDAYQEKGVAVKQDIDNLLAQIPTSEKEKQTALFMRGFSTNVKAIAKDHTVTDILDVIGIENIAQKDDFPLDTISMEAILKEDPDYIFFTTMGDEAKAKANIKKSLEDDPAWSTLTAVKEGHVYYLEKDLYHYKPNSRWAEAYEYILQIVYPDVFQ